MVEISSAAKRRGASALREIISHEAAHVVVWDQVSHTARPHGPEWAAMRAAGCQPRATLAIALYYALSAQDDFERAVLLAVNHSGDSDSTGAITGNLVGLMLGIDAIPAKWLEGLELRAQIEAVASDLYTGFDESDAWSNRYPGW